MMNIHPLLIEGNVFEKNNIEDYIIKEKEKTLKKECTNNIIYKNMCNLNEFFKEEYEEIPKIFTMLIETELNDVDYKFTKYTKIDFFRNEVYTFYFIIRYEADILEEVEKIFLKI